MNLFFAAALASIVLSIRAQETRPMNFNEVFNLIRTNLSDISEPDLSRLAALGLIKELGTKVQLVTNNAPAAVRTDEVVSRRAVYNGVYPYIQIRVVDERLPGEFDQWLKQVTQTNSARGLVIDLRYARGDDYAAAAKVADLFVKGGEPLLKLGTNEIRSTEKSKPVDLPLAVLANKETRGAAEALAALLREADAGLVLGSTTAGEARVFETFTLSTGQQIKIGTVPVQVGEQKTIPSKGLAPDIAVAVNPNTEKILYQDPYRSLGPDGAQISTASTNEVAQSTNRSRRFINEAELVRRHRSGVSLEDAGSLNGPGAPESPDQPVINDPVLARALDFLKGISALQHRPQ
jgi:C-terminal processing protease CtpA/Prc